MITKSDFSKKQLVMVFCNEGERMSLNNSNLIIKDSEGKIKFQCTLYRLFLVFIIGHCSITTPLLQASKKFGYYFALTTQNFKLYHIIGAQKDGNTLLRRKQYEYNSLDIAKHIIKNKIYNQSEELNNVRNKSEYLKEGINQIKECYSKIDDTVNLFEVLSYEGTASKIYFKHHFNNIKWNGRQPRLKRDYVNTVLDIGYTLLFAFIEAILSCYGFDIYCGVLHREFYMRKSLVCDIIEPFRIIVDHEIKKAINLKQIQYKDFIIVNHQYRLKYEESPKYVKFLMKPIMEKKNEIFLYIQAYYRAFMKDIPVDKYPIYRI